jgi:uncharacterized protein (UPF0218 family)
MVMENTLSRSGDDLFSEKTTLRLPAELRDELKNPLGELVKEGELEVILKDVGRIVTVGDKCSLTLHKIGLTPHIAIVDFKVERKDVNEMKAELQNIGKIVINVDNPPGALNKELWDVVKKAYQADEKVRIEVSGEEDLATLPCVWLAPENTAVIYGLPNVGLIVVLDLQKAKKMVCDVLMKME